VDFGPLQIYLLFVALVVVIIFFVVRAR